MSEVDYQNKVLPTSAEGNMCRRDELVSLESGYIGAITLGSTPSREGSETLTATMSSSRDH